MTTDQTHVIVGAGLAGAKAAETLRGGIRRTRRAGRRGGGAPTSARPCRRTTSAVRPGARRCTSMSRASTSSTTSSFASAAPRWGSTRRAASWSWTGRAAALRPPAAHDRRGAPSTPDPGAELEGVFYLRSVQDSDALRERIDRGGAGRRGRGLDRRRGGRIRAAAGSGRDGRRAGIGAAGARSRHEVGAIYRDIHADHGVRMLLGTGVEAPREMRSRAGAHERRPPRRLRLRRRGSGRPATHRARGSGRARHQQRRPRRRAPAGQRPVCSPPVTLRTPCIPSTASRSAWSTGPTRSTRTGSRPQHARPVGSYDRLPYFFSDQYDVGMEYSGYARGWTGRRPRRSGRPRVRRLLDVRGPRHGRHERQRLGRDRPHQAPHRRADGVEDRQLADTDLPLDELTSATRGGAA